MHHSANTTAIYFACYHSEKPITLDGAERQYRIVEEAICHEEWPYDNGDDPSFYAARHGGRLTWGVCRQDVRNAIVADSVVVFFSFRSLITDEILYRLCAVATVDDRLDHRAVHRDDRLSHFRELYVNGLITPECDGRWRYDETDRRSSQRHKDWLWRIADHRGITQETFNEKYVEIYRDGCFSDGDAASRKLRLAGNYILFSSAPHRTFISPDPPEVAIAVKGQREKWTNRKLHEITVRTAASLAENGRDYLRAANDSGRNVHRHIRFDMPAGEATRWRDELIAALKDATGWRNRNNAKPARATRTAKC